MRFGIAVRRGRAFVSNTARHLRAGHPLRESTRYFWPWWESLASGRSPLDDEIPWICFSAIDFLYTALRPDMTVFEYGTGGSTLFWARRVRQVYAVEHDRAWYERVRDVVMKQGCRNVDLRLCEPTVAVGNIDSPASLDGFASGDMIYHGYSFETYVRSIESFPDHSFDVVLIDGRARPACFAHAHPKLRPGGYLILDNPERPHYYSVHDTLRCAGWPCFEFHGPVPSIPNFSETTIWVKSGRIR
jgi:predicted O-methyltransferase YrrM